MATLNKENCEELHRSNLAQNSNVPRSQPDYITQVSEKIEQRVTKKLSQEFSRTKTCILCALSRLDEFHMNPLIHGHSGTAPETSRNTYGTNLGTHEDDSHGEPHPEAGIFQSQTTRKSGPKDGHYMVTSVHKEVTYCIRRTSSGKQKKNRSTSQPQFRSENTTATIEADHILLALQQLANNNNSANFHNNINRISKLPKWLTTTRPTFDGKPYEVEQFEDLFPTSPKFHNQWAEDGRINCFHFLKRGDAPQTFKNINGPTRKNLGEILAVFRRKYVKPQSMATAKHKFQKLVFNPANQSW